ncbi:MAG: ribosome maturation factor RimP [Leptospirillia bacterium]
MSDNPATPPSERLTEEITLLLDSMGLTLYDLVLPKKSGGVLRVFVDGPEGVTIDQIESVSRRVSVLLDVLDPFPGRYHLEVSSPGLDRLLKIPEDLRKNEGKWVNLKLVDPIDGQKVLKGRIGSVGDTGFSLHMDAGKKSLILEVPFLQLRSVQAEFWRPVPPAQEKGDKK